MKVVEASRLSIPEAKKILEKRMGEEDVTSSQRSIYEYLSRYVKVDADRAVEIIKFLEEKFGFDEFTAIQIVNIMPETVEELRILLPKDRYVSGEEASKILSVLKEKTQ